MSADSAEYRDALRTAASLFDPSDAAGTTARTSEFRRGVVNLLAEQFAEFEVETYARMDAIDADLTKAIQDFFSTEPQANAKGGVWEFKSWLRVGAESVEQARERAEEVADEVTDGPKDAQLSIEDSEPTFEGGD